MLLIGAKEGSGLLGAQAEEQRQNEPALTRRKGEVFAYVGRIHNLKDLKKKLKDLKDA